MLGQVWVVFAKEVVDNLRDRRTLLGATFSALLGPAMVVLLIVVMGRTHVGMMEKPLELPVIGAEHAPGLIDFLEQNDVKIGPGPADPEAEVRAGNLEVVLIIPAGYGDDFAGSHPATVRLVVDESRQATLASVRRARSLLDAYSRQIGALRLLARGVNPNVTHVLAVETADVATPQSQAALLLSMAPFFLVFSVFIGGMYLAIDATAGERERGSLEPLLINPVARRDLVLGKLAATILYSVAAVIATLIGFGVVLNLLPLEGYFGVRFSLSLLSLGMIFLVTLPMVLLAAPLQMVIALFTRSFKEAQNYLGFLPLVPGLPGILLAFIPVRPDLWAMLTPTFGQQVLINQVMRGEALSEFNVAIASAATIAVALALVAVTVRLFEREHLLVGR